MATSMWRMNGFCRSMAGVLLLWSLLFSSGVLSQETPSTAASSVAGTNVPAASPAAGSSQSPTVSKVSDTSSAVIMKITSDISMVSQEGGASGTTAAPVVTVKVDDYPSVVPDVKCVGKEDIQEENAVRAEVEKTDSCEATKRILEENPAKWCNSQSCSLNVFQEGNTVMVASSDTKVETLAEVLKSENLKGKLGLAKMETPSSSSSSVFVGILVSGLLAAIGIIVGYFKFPRRADTKGPKLTEEACPVDQENQGNTLESVAPLNPPPETQEKPNVNGESPEAPKTQTPPPTNGHSTTKTADTEL